MSENQSKMTKEEKEIIDEVIAKQCEPFSKYETHERIVAKDHEHLCELIDYVSECACEACGYNITLRDLSENSYFEKNFIELPVSLNLNFIDVSKVTDMSGVFGSFMYDLTHYSDIAFLVDVDLSAWNVSNVTNMKHMFYGTFAIVRGLDKWNVSKVTNMNGMFESSYIDDDISKWNVSNVTDMRKMFADSQFDGDISKWDVSNVTDMRSMFEHSQFQGDISEWNVSKVATIADIFKDSALSKKRSYRYLDKFSNAKDKIDGLISIKN